MSALGNQMLNCIRDGVTTDAEGNLREFEAGVHRIAPEVLTQNPSFADYFERDFSAPGSDATRTEVRTMTADGRTVADHRWDK